MTCNHSKNQKINKVQLPILDVIVHPTTDITLPRMKIQICYDMFLNICCAKSSLEELGTWMQVVTLRSSNIAGWKMGDPDWRCISIQNWDIPASYVSLPDGSWALVMISWGYIFFWDHFRLPLAAVLAEIVNIAWALDCLEWNDTQVRKATFCSEIYGYKGSPVPSFLTISDSIPSILGAFVPWMLVVKGVGKLW